MFNPFYWMLSSQLIANVEMLSTVHARQTSLYGAEGSWEGVSERWFEDRLRETPVLQDWKRWLSENVDESYAVDIRDVLTPLS